MIYDNSKYKDYIGRIEILEADRIYCHHDVNHFMDVARIAVIIAMEENIHISRELIYAAALLHDIGRFVQYENGTPHEKASVGLAREILDECFFDEEEKALILTAIAQHGNEDISGEKSLTGVIYRADKLSRKCYCCKAIDTCHKSDYKKNMIIKI